MGLGEIQQCRLHIFFSRDTQPKPPLSLNAVNTAEVTISLDIYGCAWGWGGWLPQCVLGKMLTVQRSSGL